MDLLKDKIMAEGRTVGKDIVKVDSFLNHQIDVEFLNEIGKEFFRQFGKEKIDKILTVEASGIAIACITAQYFKVPVIFAKKSQSRNLDNETYTSNIHSFTRQVTYQIRVAKKYLHPGERVLIVDDFLANGRAVMGLKDIIEQAEAELVGVGIVIEKGFQSGGKLLRDAGVKVISLSIIDSIQDGQIVFR